LDATTRKPRYQLLAESLRADLLAGAFTAEHPFPTETQLCALHGLSRFTVREALRALQAEGLIKRRRGSGTHVQPASARRGALHQPLSNVAEILQYAEGTAIRFAALPPAPLPRSIADTLPAAGQAPDTRAGHWAHFRGVRRDADGRAIALTDAWLHPDLGKAAARLDLAGKTIFRQIEALAGLQVARVTQDIQAVAASAEIAEQLAIPRRAPCLRILRCYHDGDGRLFEISASHHPGDRFAYQMHIDVESSDHGA
jgi:DNA-binding GntR family transcriptional regulator